MGSPKIDLILEGMIRMLIHLKYKGPEIIKEMEKLGHKLSSCKIRNVKLRMEAEKSHGYVINTDPMKRPRKRRKMDPEKIEKLKEMLNRDPKAVPTQREMAKEFGVNAVTIHYHIEKSLGYKLTKCKFTGPSDSHFREYRNVIKIEPPKAVMKLPQVLKTKTRSSRKARKTKTATESS